MPRSVPHHFDGVLSDIQLRVWERPKNETFHAIVEGRYVHRCDREVDHELEVHARWDMPAAASPWYDLTRRARDGDGGAAGELAGQMVVEAVEAEWRDPCRDHG